MNPNLHPKPTTDLMTISIRRRLDKGEPIKSNEVRMLCAMIDQLKARIADLETKAVQVVAVAEEAVTL